MHIGEAQEQNFRKYYETSIARGVDKTFTRLVEEVGEVAKALRNKDGENLREELADVLAWTLTLASLSGIGLEAVYLAKYGTLRCFRCEEKVCICPEVIA